MPTAALSDLTPSLLAFWVGDNDIFAASDAAQAQALGNALAGFAAYALADVTPVEAETLDEPLQDGQGRALSLRAVLGRRLEPGYLAGYEQ